MHIEKYYAPDNFNVYAHYVAIVQSLGMGKSRTVDELGKKHFSIPINPREAKSTGMLFHPLLILTSINYAFACVLSRLPSSEPRSARLFDQKSFRERIASPSLLFH